MTLGIETYLNEELANPTKYVWKKFLPYITNEKYRKETEDICNRKKNFFCNLDKWHSECHDLAMQVAEEKYPNDIHRAQMDLTDIQLLLYRLCQKDTEDEVFRLILPDFMDEAVLKEVI